MISSQIVYPSYDTKNFVSSNGRCVAHLAGVPHLIESAQTVTQLSGNSTIILSIFTSGDPFSLSKEHDT